MILLVFLPCPSPSFPLNDDDLDGNYDDAEVDDIDDDADDEAENDADDADGGDADVGVHDDGGGDNVEISSLSSLSLPLLSFK